MFRYYYKDPDGDITEITSHHVRIGDAELVSNAEEGSVGSGYVAFDDPDGTFAIRGHRLFVVNESEASSDPYGGTVWMGYAFNRQWHRNMERTDGARECRVNLVDINTLLNDRIEHGADCHRPAEDDLDRVAWLLSTTEMGLTQDDDTYVESSGGEPMDKVDYTHQKPLEILDDCAQQSGRNYFLLWQDAGVTVPHVFLWYRHATDDFWKSDIRISNVPGEYHDPLVDLAPDTFAPSFDAELDRDPSRVYSMVDQLYDGGYVFVDKPSTSSRFRNRHTPGRGENVKTETKARRRARRYLDDIDVELDVITCAILVPRRLVNAAMAGQAIDVHFSHLPGYADGFVSMRIRDRTVREVSPELVEIALSLTRDDATDTAHAAVPAFCTLDYAHSKSGQIVHFSGTGDDPPPGWKVEPTVGPLTPLSDGTPRPWYAIQVDDDGTVDIEFTASFVGVMTKPSYVVQWTILLNGSAVAWETQAFVNEAFPHFQGQTGKETVTIAGLAVANGDLITASVSCSPVMAFFKVPAGVGTGGERLAVTDGTF